jgi:hypothetical protein
MGREPALAVRAPRLARPRKGPVPGDRDPARRAAQLRRQQALVVPALRLASAFVAALALAPAALSATLPTTTLAARPNPTLSKQDAIKIFVANPKVADWLKRYPPNPVTDAVYDDGIWTVNVWSGKAGAVATGKVIDSSGFVSERWTGPQVAWSMARGARGAFGGEFINRYSVWLAFCAVFVIGLADWRRLRSLRNADVAVLLSFSVALWFFNRGDVFTAMPLVYPGFLWLLARCVWIGWRERTPPTPATWPVWAIAGAAIFVGGFRVMANVRSSNVIDVGFSGPVGADRIARGQSPYGHFPVEEKLKPCGPKDTNGEIRNRIQTNGRCETANALGDTYGPVAYEAYLPGYWIFGWSGKWDDLPAAHATSILFDLLCLLGLVLVGRRFGGDRFAATLAFAWVAWPFTQYVSSSNTNDAILPAFLIWGFYFLTSPFARGAFLALSAWTKFAPLLLLPLWAGYPEARRARPTAIFAAGFLLATVLAFFVLLLEPSPPHAARVFFDRTIRWQIGRESPFSLWGWGAYHAKGLPDLHWVQRALQAALVVGALALGWWPRRRSALRLAALTAAVLIGFELVLTHWFFLYLPWFFPFVAIALFWPNPRVRGPARSS